jgi:hypothetical protein
MGIIGRFFTQPAKNYRNFQIVFMILTLNFAIPSLSYALTPQVAIDQFVQLNQFLGGRPYDPQSELASHFWWYLGTANVMALAFMCLILQVNLRRFYPVLVPLTFLKATAATLWFIGFVKEPHFRAFLAGAVLDYVTSAAFVFFATRAHAEIRTLADDVLIPRPRGGAQ